LFLGSGAQVAVQERLLLYFDGEFLKHNYWVEGKLNMQTGLLKYACVGKLQCKEMRLIEF